VGCCMSLILMFSCRALSLVPCVDRWRVLSKQLHVRNPYLRTLAVYHILSSPCHIVPRCSFLCSLSCPVHHSLLTPPLFIPEYTSHDICLSHPGTPTSPSSALWLSVYDCDPVRHGKTSIEMHRGPRSQVSVCVCERERAIGGYE
jgi:hypothetical protein